MEEHFYTKTLEFHKFGFIFVMRVPVENHFQLITRLRKLSFPTDMINHVQVLVAHHMNIKTRTY